MEIQENLDSKEVFHDISNSSFLFSGKVIIIFIISILLGIGGGYVLAKKNNISGSLGAQKNSANLTIGAIYGSGDSATFSDMAEGVVQRGGIGNEGQFHLVRPGGESQNVYMTSSLVDLMQFINHKVKVWGQTQKAKQAGWLMDVGKLEVEN